MFIPSIIVQNCEGRAARARQALIMYHPYLHLYPDLVISISTDSPYIKQNDIIPLYKLFSCWPSIAVKQNLPSFHPHIEGMI